MGSLPTVNTITVERRISAPTERVWAVLTDLDGAPERISAIELLERLSGPDFDVGTRWRETRTMFGRQATEEMEVTAIEPGRAYTVEAGTGGTKYVSELAVEGRDDGTSLLQISFGAEPQNLVSKLLSATIGRLFAGVIEEGLRIYGTEPAAAPPTLPAAAVETVVAVPTMAAGGGNPPNDRPRVPPPAGNHNNNNNNGVVGE